ncbi:MarR family transcriptional regulator [Saccharopolyspora sp. K220]|uniref:MarR family winged helix-turn-helix transcriptional regulator n=1 Tax=Saccharopolyspora soli TaxID=2926618 RepID=UPI001F5AF38A|nr:MarR family transcriptional regulator [Saccharopolyspora soli]MCI2416625.1 MarR family transcriptional regulator [Saccharopolyspora soli]
MSELDPQTVADELMTVTTALRRVVRRSLRDELPGPHPRGAQIELLRVVEQRPGISVAAAAVQLRLAANSVSTLVNQLVRIGMLHRETDPDDRRAVRLRLTNAAAHRLVTWRHARTDLVREAFANLSTVDQEAVAGALRGLNALVDGLEGSSADDRADGGALHGAATDVRRTRRGGRD